MYFVPPEQELKLATHVRHRKNAAEWLMFVVLLPFVPIAWVVARLNRR